MQPIQNPPPPPIGPNTDSDTVANLQDALIFLFEQGRLQLSDEEPEVLQQDLIDQSYREGTRQAAITFRSSSSWIRSKLSKSRRAVLALYVEQLVETIVKPGTLMIKSGGQP